MTIRFAMRSGVGNGFAPLVRVRSNRNGENVFIYARPRGRYVEMMILVHEKDETVLVRVVANARSWSASSEDHGG